MNKLTPRTWTMIIAGLVLFALILLAASINTLTLAEGRPLPLGKMTPEVSNSGDAPSWMNFMMTAFRILMIFVWVMIPIYIIYLIISKEARKRFMRDLIIIMPVLLLLYIMSNRPEGQKAAQELGGRFGGDAMGETGEMPEVPPLPEFQPPPPWVATAASVALAVVAVLLVSGAIYLIWRKTREKESQPLRQIRSRAREAIRQIETGGDLSEVIQRCYLQMVEVMRETRNIYRGRDMTPHEFEILLEDRGMPAEPVHQLTVLFEQVRYGAQRPGRTEERIAINSLNAIVAACERAQDREQPRASERGV